MVHAGPRRFSSPAPPSSWPPAALPDGRERAASSAAVASAGPPFLRARGSRSAPRARRCAARASGASRAQPIAAADLAANPPGRRFRTDEEVACTFRLRPSEGWSPKFECALASGEEVKVKYGRNSVEVFGEVAATPPPLRARLRGRPDVRREGRPVPRLPGLSLSAVRDPGRRAPGGPPRGDVQAGRHRAQDAGPPHPGRAARRLGLAGAGPDRSRRGRLDPGGGGRAAPHGRVPQPLGQQGAEPAARVPGRRRTRPPAARRPSRSSRTWARPSARAAWTSTAGREPESGPTPPPAAST